MRERFWVLLVCGLWGIMEAIRFSAKEKKLTLEKVPIPKLVNPYDVLIKVAYSGICGTDLHIIQVGTFIQNSKCY